MDKNVEKKSIIQILTEHFPNQKFELHSIDYGGAIYAFLIKSDNEEILKNTWEKIRNMIGVYFQSTLEVEFEIWNIYLFFITETPISKDLKHKIEHDTMSSRKIVVDNHKEIKAMELKDFLISEHIVNSNLKTSIQTLKIQAFSKNVKLSKAIDSIDLSQTKKDKEATLVSVLNKIEKSISK